MAITFCTIFAVVGCCCAFAGNFCLGLAAEESLLFLGCSWTGRLFSSSISFFNWARDWSLGFGAKSTSSSSAKAFSLLSPSLTSLSVRSLLDWECDDGRALGGLLPWIFPITTFDFEAVVGPPGEFHSSMVTSKFVFCLEGWGEVQDGSGPPNFSGKWKNCAFLTT